MLKAAEKAWRLACVGHFTLLLLAGSAQTAYGLDLTLTGDAKAVEEYDTNLFRTLAPHDPAWGQGVDGQIDFSATDEFWETRANARFANRWYVTDNNLDYYNQLFDWRTKYRSEYSIWNMDAQYNMDNTLSSETDSTVDVGYVFRRIPRTTRILSPSWTYSLSDTSLLSLSYDYNDRTYDRNQVVAANVVDSIAHTGGLLFQHQWNSDLTLTGSANYTDYTLLGQAGTYIDLLQVPIGDTIFALPALYNRPALDSTIRTTSAMAGFNWAATSTITLGFSGGAQYNQTETPGFVATTLVNGALPGPSVFVPGTSNNAVTEILSATARKRFEYSDIGFDYSRSVSPNLNGDLVAYDRYSLSGNHRFSEWVSSNLSLSYSEQSSPSQGTAAFLNREIFSARTGLNWQWDENWFLNASYQYTQVTYPDSGTADSHALFLNLRYLFDKHKL